MPASDEYSRVTNRERFRSLHEAALQIAAEAGPDPVAALAAVGSRRYPQLRAPGGLSLRVVR